MASIRRSVIVSILFAVFGDPGLVVDYSPLWIRSGSRAFAFPCSSHRGRSSPPERSLPSVSFLFLLPSGDSSLSGRGTLMPGVLTEHLVVCGLYRSVRNPMYLGVLALLIGGAVLFRSRDMVIEALTAWLATRVFVVLHGEPTLASHHPAAYPIDKRNVPRRLPRLTPWNGCDAGAQMRTRRLEHFVHSQCPT